MKAKGSQMERLIQAAGGAPADGSQVRSKYPTAGQMERLIEAMGGGGGSGGDGFTVTVTRPTAGEYKFSKTPREVYEALANGTKVTVKAFNKYGNAVIRNAQQDVSIYTNRTSNSAVANPDDGFLAYGSFSTNTWTVDNTMRVLDGDLALTSFGWIGDGRVLSWSETDGYPYWETAEITINIESALDSLIQSALSAANPEATLAVVFDSGVMLEQSGNLAWNILQDFNSGRGVRIGGVLGGTYCVTNCASEQPGGGSPDVVTFGFSGDEYSATIQKAIHLAVMVTVYYTSLSVQNQTATEAHVCVSATAKSATIV